MRTTTMAGCVVLWLAAATASANEDRSEMGTGLRGGMTFNGDQLVLGMHWQLASLGDFAFGSAALVGGGDAWMTLRTSALARWAFLRLGGLRFYSVVSSAALFFTPVGKLGAFCRATGLSCDGAATGLELGAGVEYGSVGLEATGGTNGLPAMTLLATYRLAS